MIGAQRAFLNGQVFAVQFEKVIADKSAPTERGSVGTVTLWERTRPRSLASCSGIGLPEGPEP